MQLVCYNDHTIISLEKKKIKSLSEFYLAPNLFWFCVIFLLEALAF